MTRYGKDVSVSLLVLALTHGHFVMSPTRALFLPWFYSQSQAGGHKESFSCGNIEHIAGACAPKQRRAQRTYGRQN